MNIEYTVFLLDGMFMDSCVPGAEFVRLDGVNDDELRVLLSLTVRNRCDMVVRACEKGEEE